MLFDSGHEHCRAKGRWLRAVGPIGSVSYLRGRNADIPHDPLALRFPGNVKRRTSQQLGRPPSFSRQRKKKGAPLMGTPFFGSRVLSGGIPPLPDVYRRALYAQMVSAASLPEVRAQPLLAPEGLLEPMTAPTTSPQANRPWMDSPALF